MELKPAYLIAGSDWPKVDAALRRLRTRFDEEAVETLSVAAGDDGRPDIVAACNAMGLFGGPRLVLVRGAEALTDDEGAAIAAYLADPAPDTVLGLFGGAGVPPDGPLARAVARAGDVRLFDAPDRKGATAWVVRRFSERGVRCPQDVARRLVALVGEDFGELSLEVEKVATWCDGVEPTVEDVERLVLASAEVKPWEITDAWGQRDRATVLALATADVERPDDVHRMVGSLLSHVRKVRRALVMTEAGAGVGEVQKELRMRAAFPAQKLVSQSRRFAEPELAAAIVRLAELDLAIKGGSRLDPRFELELALADITAG